MGIPVDAKFITSPQTISATLPTPAQTPPTKHLGLATPIADSYGDIFDLSKDVPDDAPPPYTDKELELALENLPVQATLYCNESRVLHGTFYYLPSLFYKLYERFFDISPSDYPRLGTPYCKPWVVFNETHGHTWVDETLLHLLGVNTAQQPNQEPRFVAVTDNFQVLLRAEAMGTSLLASIGIDGALTPTTALHVRSDIIVALPADQALPSLRSAPLRFSGLVRPMQLAAAGKEVLPIKDFTPAPTTSDVLEAVRKILGAEDNSANMSNSIPKKGWLTKNLAEHFGEDSTQAPSGFRPAPCVSLSPSPAPGPALKRQQSKSKYGVRQNNILSTSSPLYAHRGNEALFKRAIWQQLCYSSGHNDGNVEAKGGVKLPDAYSQVLFEDLQGRERVPGSEQLAGVDRKWYVPEEFEEGGWLAKLKGRVGKVEGDGYGGGGDGERMEVD